MPTTRRRCLLAGAAALLAPQAHAALLATPHQTEGPFYPWKLPLDRDNDLLRIGGSGATARGEIAHLSGRVLDASGQPLVGARVEIWQCDANGHYHHVDDRDPDGRDPHFQGYGHTQTAPDGGYRFRTIKPVPYPGRTPHIHFKVRAGTRELSTQLYVRDDPRNARDFLFRSLDEDERERVQARFVTVDPAEAGWVARFDLVLA